MEFIFNFIKKNYTLCIIKIDNLTGWVNNLTYRVIIYGAMLIICVNYDVNYN